MSSNPSDANQNASYAWLDDNQTGDSNYAALDIVSLFRLVLKWWWVFLLFVGLACCAAYFVTKKIVPEYRAASLIEIKQKETRVIDVSGLDQVTADREYLLTQIALLESRAISDEVVKSLKLFSNPDFTDTSLPLDDRIANASTNLKDHISVSTLGISRLISISVEDESPALATKIANAYAEKFVDYNADKRFDTNSYAKEFVEERLVEAKEVLEQSERKLAQYADDTNIIDLTNGLSTSEQGVSDSLSGSALFTLNEEYDKTRSEALLFKQRYEQVSAGIDTQEIITDPTLSTLMKEQSSLEAEYNNKLETYKPSFPIMRDIATKKEAVEEQIKNRRQTLVGMFEARYREKETLAADIQNRINRLKGSIKEERTASINYNILQREVETNRMQYEALLTRLNELAVTDDVGSNLVSIVEMATTPKKPFKPNFFRNLLATAFASASLVVLLIFIIEKLNDKIRAPEDTLRKLQKRAIGVIPYIKGENKKNLSSLDDPTSTLSESFASLRSNLIHHFEQTGTKSIHVTSTRQDEGKSFAVVALARGFAELNMRTLVIDADMRKPTLTAPRGAVGLAGLLTSSEPLMDHCFETQKGSNLFLLPCGPIPSNPSSLLAGSRFSEVLEHAKEQFDIVIIDSPPVLGLVDAPTISALCKGTLYVIECGTVHSKAILSSLKRLEQTGGQVIGIVLNKYRAPSSKYLNYNYYAYGQQAYSYGGAGVKRKAIFRGLFKRNPKRKKVNMGFDFD